MIKRELYLKSIPLIYNTNSSIERKMYLRDLYNTVILKDIVQRN